MLTIKDIQQHLGQEESLLSHICSKIPKKMLHLPNPNWLDEIHLTSDRSIRVINNLKRLFSTGRLADTGYLSILPVDQGIEHSAGASFAKNPLYFDPENIIKLALESGCNAVASTLGVLGIVARKYAHKIPFIMKINHNELLTYPNHYDQIIFANVQQAYDMGATAIGATIYFGSAESDRQITEISHAFAKAHELGMATILWCYLRNPSFKIGDTDYHESADLTGQANYLGVTIGADIIKQKIPTNNFGYQTLNKNEVYGKFDEKIYTDLSSSNPIDLCRYQVLNCFSGRAGLINSGGASGNNNLSDAIRLAVINKRAGGMGLISGRKTFQCPFEEGIKIFHAIQDVYLCSDVTIA